MRGRRGLPCRRPVAAEARVDRGGHSTGHPVRLTHLSLTVLLVTLASGNGEPFAVQGVRLGQLLWSLLGDALGARWKAPVQPRRVGRRLPAGPRLECWSGQSSAVGGWRAG